MTSEIRSRVCSRTISSTDNSRILGALEGLIRTNEAIAWAGQLFTEDDPYVGW